MQKIRIGSKTCRRFLGGAALGLLLSLGTAAAAPPTPGPAVDEELLWVGSRTGPAEAPAALAPPPSAVAPAEASTVERRQRVADLLRSFASRPLPSPVEETAALEVTPGAAPAEDALYQEDEYDEDAFDLLD